MPPRASADQAADDVHTLRPPEPNIVTDGSVNRAIGDELRRVRDDLGWTRSMVIERMSSDISVQALANYEHGLRPCTLPRLVELCEALEVPTPALVALALQRISVEPDADSLQIDLRAVIATEDTPYPTLRVWAQNRLKSNPGGTGVARLERAAIEEMATIFDLSVGEFLRYLRRFIPERTPRRILWD